MLAHENLLPILAGISTVPIFPENYSTLIKALNSTSPSHADIVCAIQADAGLSVKVLQLINSAYLGASIEVSTIPDAVSFLGIAKLKDIVGSLGADSLQDSNVCDDFDDGLTNASCL